MHVEENNTKKSFGSISKKALALSAVAVIALSSTVGGTIAWLITKSDSAVNTFTYGDINIELTETDTDGDGDPNNNTYEMIPGKSFEKDPLVTVLEDSEDCWLFVELNKSDNFDAFMTYAMAEGWTALEGNDGIYYREVAGSEDAQEFGIIADNTVTVSGDVTKAMLNELDTVGYPTLTVTAYAVQRDGDIEDIDTAAEAWALVLDETEAE